MMGKGNMDTTPEEESLLHHSSSPAKGGLRTMPFIIVTESVEKVASYGLLPNMIIYLMRDYHLEAATATTILFLWSALSNGLAIFGAFLADSYLGRFRVIAIGSISSLLGMTLVWLTAMIPELKPQPCDQFEYSCSAPNATQIALLLSSFGLISIGAGCVGPCSIAFGADQLVKKDDPNNEMVLDSYFNWYYASAGISSVLAMTVIVYIQDHYGWRVGFGVPPILMGFSFLIFLLGSSLYIKVKASESLLTGFAQVLFAQVLAAAFRKRNISLPFRNCDENYYNPGESMFLAPADDFRCFNKACIIQDPESDLNPEGSASNAWSLCSVEQVESLKALLRLVPMWSTGIMLLVSLNQGSFTNLQTQTMDRHIFSNFQIPAGSFKVFMVASLTVWIAFYNCALVPLLKRYTGRQQGLSPIVRMGIGLVISCAAMALSAITESVRRQHATEKDLQDDANAMVLMSALWLVPQEVLLGLAEAFNAIGQIEYFYTHFPKSMSSIAVAIYTLEIAVSSLVGSVLVNIVDSVTAKIGKVSWLSSNLDEGHLDYYFWLLTLLNVVNFLFFLICCWSNKPRDDRRIRSSPVAEEKEYEYMHSASS